MRLDKPRVDPIPPEAFEPEVRARFGEGPILNIFRTIANHPKLLKRWLVFGNHVLSKSTLPGRDRELAILRVAWRCDAEYEWAQHAPIARREGVDPTEIERVREGPDADGWSESDRALLQAVDELDADAFISDGTWQALGRSYDTQQCMDLIFTVGQYRLVAMALNSLGVQLESGATGFPPA